MQIAVLIETKRAVVVGEQDLEVVEVARDVGVDRLEALGERDFGTLRPVLDHISRSRQRMCFH